METKKVGRKRINQPAFDKIDGRKQVFITRKEWKLVTPPGAHLLRKYLGKEYVVRTAVDDSGWLIKMR